MRKDDFGLQTTVRVAPGDKAHSRFARPFKVSDKLLAAVLPALWALVAIVVLVVVVVRIAGG